MDAASGESRRASSRKDAFRERMEALILSGAIEPGTRLPPERDLAATLGVSRPVVHEGLLELAQRGLVELRPRHGARVRDYRRHASLALLQSLFRHHDGAIEAGLLTGLLDLRRLVEVEGARLAARNATAEDAALLRALLAAEEATPPADLARVVRLDFEFHHQVAVAGGNPVLPMLIRSFQPAFANLGAHFYRVEGVVPVVRRLHRELVEAVRRRDETRAADCMHRLLAHGVEALGRTPVVQGGSS